MGLKLSTKKSVYPVTIDDLEYMVDLGDESVIKVSGALKEMLDSLEKEKEDAPFDKAFVGRMKAVVKRGYDSLLGGGAFEAVYKKTESVSQCSIILYQISMAITDEVNKDIDSLPKYIAKKQDKGR